MATKITYNGKTIDVPSGDIAILPCKDFTMATDVVVEAPEGEGKEPNLISKTITENGTYKINEKSALGTWRLNSDFKITSVIDVRTEIEGTFVAVAEDGTIQELPLRRFRLNTFDNNTYGTLALKSSRHGFPFSNTTIFDHKQTIRLETYDASAGLLYDQKDIPLDSELGEQLRYFTITNVGVMQIGTEEALTEWLYANCTKIANIDGYSEVIVNVPSEAPNLCGIDVTPTKDIQNIVPEGDFDGFDEVIVNPIPDEYVIPNLISKTITENGTYKASEDVDDSTPIGTWVLNDTATYGLDGTYTINGVMNYGKYQGSHLLTRSISNPVILIKSTGQNPFWAKNSDGSERCYYDKTAGWYCGDYTTTTTYKAYNPMLTINEVTDGDSNGLLTWLKANGKKTASTTTVDGYTEVIVNVEATDSAIPTEISTEAEMTALLTSGEVGGVYKYTGTTGTYENGALYVLEAELGSFTYAQTSSWYSQFVVRQFLIGMTWAEFIASEYNAIQADKNEAGTFGVKGQFINQNGYVMFSGTDLNSANPLTIPVFNNSYSSVAITDVIYGGTYMSVNNSGGGSGN